jgi:hypothetical protein
MKTKPIKEMSRGVINRPPFALRKFAGASAHCNSTAASYRTSPAVVIEEGEKQDLIAALQ